MTAERNRTYPACSTPRVEHPACNIEAEDAARARGQNAGLTPPGRFSSIYWLLPGAFAALFPSLIASASVMYLPFLVVP